MERFTTWTPVDKDQSRPEIRVICPSCREFGLLEKSPAGDIEGPPPPAVNNRKPRRFAFVRRCPNPQCAQLVFGVAVVGGNSTAGVERSDRVEVESLHPPPMVDFDRTALPEAILECVEEAAMCITHGCHRAAAMMVRRTLEELCSDRAVTGANLYERLQNLGDAVVLPPRLLDGLDGIRVLGNDAAHIEARDYATVGHEQVDVAFEVCKEILKAVYQYESLVGRLEALRTTELVDGQ